MSINQEMKTGNLYLVATPIGNLQDITLRALDILKTVDYIAAEDTRHSEKLLRHYHIESSLISYHDHNAAARNSELIALLKQGKTIALISDAGTPLISDPGHSLVNEAIKHDIAVISIPGPSAMISALTISGLPSHRFSFEGFLPAKNEQKKEVLDSLQEEERTMIFYESPHRIINTLASMIDIWGHERNGVVARELTKYYESVYRGTLGELLTLLKQHKEFQLGEFVIVVEGAKKLVKTHSEKIELSIEQILILFLKQHPIKEAVKLAEEISGQRKNYLYELALQLKNRKKDAADEN